MSEEREHALLSASSASKWLVCTPSARLEEQFENKTSEYMAEGTLAHEIAEFRVKSYFLDPITKTTYTRRLNKFKKVEHFNNDMLEATDIYLEYIKNIAMQTSQKPFIAVEVKIDYSEWVPEGFGTSDCILISNNTLHVVDYKHGKGVSVSSENNPQMQLYALGAYNKYKLFYQIENVVMHIVQPRIDNVSSFELALEDLLNWAETVIKPQAQKAFAGIGDFVQGEHCRFCRAKGACEFRAKENMKVVEEIQNTTGTLSTGQISEMLTKTEGVELWIKDLKTYALEELLKGVEIPGWKAVEGKSNRKIVDVDKAFDILEANGYDKTILYEKNPLGLTALEKLVGKKKLADAIGDYIEKPKGSPSLAKESDKREKYSTKTTAIEDFKE